MLEESSNSYGFTLIEYFIFKQQIQSYCNSLILMISNNGKIALGTKLYLKEFFSNYFNQKDYREIVSSFSGGLQVLSGLINKFEESHGLVSNPSKPIEISQKSEQMPFTKKLERESQRINASFQNLYHRLSQIFEHFAQLFKNNEKISDQPIQKKFVISNVNDQELYQMINEYKLENKKLKQIKKKLQFQCSQNQMKIEQLLQKEEKSQKQMNKKELQIKALQQKVNEYQKDVEELREQICCLTVVQNQLQNELSSHDQLLQEFEVLKLELQNKMSLLNNEKLRTQKLQAKVDQFQQIISNKIKEKQNLIANIVSSKLQKQQIWENNACKSLKNFIKSIKVRQL